MPFTFSSFFVFFFYPNICNNLWTFYNFKGRFSRNGLMLSIWISPACFPGSSSHSCTTLHDTVCSAFSFLIISCGLFSERSLKRWTQIPRCFCLPLLSPGLHICSAICAWKRQREVLVWTKSPLTTEVPRQPENTCEVSCFWLCFPSAIGQLLISPTTSPTHISDSWTDPINVAHLA